MRENGLHDQAAEIEAMLKQVIPADVTADTRASQLKEARAFAEKALALSLTLWLPPTQSDMVFPDS